jgi:hypothetical protein
MIQNKDYILQLIEAAGKAVAKMMGFKEQGSYSQALETLEDCYSEHFDRIHIESESNYIKLDTYGNLLKHEAEINQEVGNQEKAKELYLKALQSLNKAETESKSFDLKRNSLIKEIQLSLIIN